jgi:RNA polymerase sporulation-specific sigma factor
MLHAIEAARREKNRPLNTSVLLEDGAIAATASLAAGDQDPESLVISQEMLDERMKGLTDSLSAMEKEVLSGYLSGMSTGEIASRLGKTPKSVDNALQRIRKKSKFQKKS